MTTEEMAGPPSRRRMDGEVRKEQILAAAGRLYAEDPYEQVSTAQISAASGISQALVFHYFGTKAGLYTAVISRAIDQLREAQDAAIQRLPDGAPARERIKESALVYLDHISTYPHAWAASLRTGLEPVSAQQLRADVRREFVERLAASLRAVECPRHTYALWGYFGFLDQACLRWVDQGCPRDERDALVAASLGALEGGFGDLPA